MSEQFQSVARRAKSCPTFMPSLEDASEREVAVLSSQTSIVRGVGRKIRVACFFKVGRSAGVDG